MAIGYVGMGLAPDGDRVWFVVAGVIAGAEFSVRAIRWMGIMLLALGAGGFSGLAVVPASVAGQTGSTGSQGAAVVSLDQALERAIANPGMPAAKKPPAPPETSRSSPVRRPRRRAATSSTG